MASDKHAVGLCDICGWRYPLRELKYNSYKLRVCPTDFEGGFDLVNHPQNFTANLKDNETIRDPRPDPNIDRNLEWQLVNTNWEDININWQNI
jgi:hypothetical protein